MPNKNHLGPMLMSQWAFSWYQSPKKNKRIFAFLRYFNDRKIIILTEAFEVPRFLGIKSCPHQWFPNSRWEASWIPQQSRALITGWDSFFSDIHSVYYPHLKPFVENDVPSRNDKYHEKYHRSFIKDFQGSTTTLVFVYRNNLSWNFETKDEPFSYVVSHHQEKLYHSFQVKRKSLSVCQGGNGVVELWVWKSSQIVEESP